MIPSFLIPLALGAVQGGLAAKKNGQSFGQGLLSGAFGAAPDAIQKKAPVESVMAAMPMSGTLGNTDSLLPDSLDLLMRKRFGGI